MLSGCRAEGLRVFGQSCRSHVQAVAARLMPGRFCSKVLVHDRPGEQDVGAMSLYQTRSCDSLIKLSGAGGLHAQDSLLIRIVRRCILRVLAAWARGSVLRFALSRSGLSEGSRRCLRATTEGKQILLSECGFSV